MSIWGLLLVMQGEAEPRVGAPLPAWAPGTMDIHQISTGRGNAALVVMPDGTTLLVDAGAAAGGIPQADPHPDSSRSTGAWIARYVRRHLPDTTAGLDYGLLTHFHADHYGVVGPRAPLDPTGAYRLAGITEVGAAIPIRTLIDRGLAAGTCAAPAADSTLDNYRKFLEARPGMAHEQFRPGSREQIRLRRDATAYADFEVRNIVGNGELWTGGSDSTTRALFPAVGTIPEQDLPHENMCSLGIRIGYGRFRYFTGGDLPGTADPGFPPWHALEAAVAPVVGHVDVHVVNHHGSVGAETEPFLRILASTVLVVPSWSPTHLAPDVLKRIVNSRFPPRERLVFVTDLREATRIAIGPRASTLGAPPGHVVVRVEPGGARYWVAVVTNADESGRVVGVRGPFEVR